MIIPIIAIPVSIIGTFAGMLVLGFSINLLTLFGLVLAIGIVVDDAIVVLENVERIMSTEGKGPREAAIQAMQEVTGPVVAIALVLCAVFIPVSILGGLAGAALPAVRGHHRRLGGDLGRRALTLTPALAALLLKPAHGPPWRPFVWFNRSFAWLTARYTGGVGFLLRRTVLGCLGFVLVLGGVFALFQRIPGSLVPAEDQGYVFMVTVLPPRGIHRPYARGHQGGDGGPDEEPGGGRRCHLLGLRPAVARAQDQLRHLLRHPQGLVAAQRSQGGCAQRRAGTGGHQCQLQGRRRRRLQSAADPGISVTGGFEFYLQDRSGGS